MNTEEAKGKFEALYADYATLMKKAGNEPVPIQFDTNNA